MFSKGDIDQSAHLSTLSDTHMINITNHHTHTHTVDTHIHTVFFINTESLQSKYVKQHKLSRFSLYI